MDNELNRLMEVLQAAVKRAGSTNADAIDTELNRPPRQTEVHSLADDPAVLAFRNELIDGLIRADTANQLLRLVAMIVERLA